MSKEELQRMLELEPDNVDLLIENARMARIDGKINQAKNYLLLAMQKDPEYSLVNIEYGLLLNQSGMIHEANKYFEKAKINLNSRNFVELLYLTEIFWDLKNYQYCLDVIQNLVKNPYKKDELHYLEKVYNSFVINMDLKLVETKNQLMILITLADYLKKEEEMTFYSKIMKKRFNK